MVASKEPIMSQSERRFSFEFFPAKTEAGHEKLLATARNLAGYKPDFFSCTYGAGGSTRDRTLSTVLQLDGEVKVPTAPHLSCVGDSKAELRELLGRYREAGIRRIVALRGDLPSGMGMASGELRYANELVDFIRTETGDHFHIEVAAYPEVHPQARSFEDDLANFVRKVKAGASSAITQYFFNADAYFYFVERVAKLGVDIPVVPASCRSPTTPSWRASPTPAAPNCRAGSASNWKPTATTAAASRPSASRSSARCANACWRAAHRDCISIL
ncbi:hypothetical protein PA6761_00274 [Pseudomonas aeruginosa]